MPNRQKMPIPNSNNHLCPLHNLLQIKMDALHRQDIISSNNSNSSSNGITTCKFLNNNNNSNNNNKIIIYQARVSILF